MPKAAGAVAPLPMQAASNDVGSGWNGTQIPMHDQLTPRHSALQLSSNSMQRKTRNAATMMQPLPRWNKKPSLG